MSIGDPDFSPDSLGTAMRFIEPSTELTYSQPPSPPRTITTTRMETPIKVRLGQRRPRLAWWIDRRRSRERDRRLNGT